MDKRTASLSQWQGREGVTWRESIRRQLGCAHTCLPQWHRLQRIFFPTTHVCHSLRQQLLPRPTEISLSCQPTDADTKCRLLAIPTYINTHYFTFVYVCKCVCTDVNANSDRHIYFCLHAGCLCTLLIWFNCNSQRFMVTAK